MYRDKEVFQAVACDVMYSIGKNGGMLWQPGDMPSDMERFVALTTGKSVLMGRKTWDSIPTKFRPLRRRQNIILTHNQDFKVDEPNVVVAHSLEEAFVAAQTLKVFVIGGAEIYKLTLPFTDQIFLTVVDNRFNGDTAYPWRFDRNKWKLESHEDAYGNGRRGDKYTSSFYHYIRIPRAQHPAAL